MGEFSVRLSSQQIIERIHTVHQDRYQFPQIDTEYKGSDSKITAICKDHGSFLTSLTTIKAGCGCPKCGIIRQSNSTRLSPQQVRVRISDISNYDYKFPYIENEYINNQSKLTAICELHGTFFVTLANATKGNGCPICGNLKRSVARRFTPQQALDRIRKVCGTMYQFPQIESEYINNTSEITVICEIHGKFISDLAHLVNGGGCPECGRIKSSIARRNIIIQPGLADYDRFHSQLPITDCAHCGPDGELKVLCKLCRKSMTPTLTQVNNRIRVINIIDGGESNFYCSDKCKSECTVFGKTHRYKPPGTDYEANVREARRCQPESKYRLRQIQFDTYGYHFCEKCGKIVINNQLHHTIEVAKDPKLALSPAGHMLVCDPCHKEFTVKCR